jgi:hypothetical protein
LLIGWPLTKDGVEKVARRVDCWVSWETSIDGHTDFGLTGLPIKGRPSISEYRLNLTGQPFLGMRIKLASATTQSRGLQLRRRPAQLHRLADYMLDEWPQHEGWMQPTSARSASPTAASPCSLVAGGIPDVSEIGPYCRAHTDHDRCQVPKHTGADPHLGAGAFAGA